MSSPKTAEDYAATIRKLLDRASATESQDEADLCTQKAQAIMDKHMISEALVHGAKNVPDEIDTMELEFRGIFGQATRDLGWVVAHACDCRAVFIDPRRAPKRYMMIVHGYRTDLERVKLLDASLQIQCARALKAWVKEQPRTWHELRGFAKFKDRWEFINSFGIGVHVKLAATRQEAVREAATTRATETGQSVQEASSGVELVLRDRADNVDDWFDEHYGGSLRSVKTRRAAGSYGAQSAGFTAGNTADIGQPRVSGGRRQIER